MAIEPTDKLRDANAAAREAHAVKRSLSGFGLFLVSLILFVVLPHVSGVEMVGSDYGPYIMAVGAFVALYWLIQAWRTPGSGGTAVPKSVEQVAAIAVDPGVAGSGADQPNPEAKHGVLSFLVVVVIVLCFLHMAFIHTLHNLGNGFGAGYAALFAMIAYSVLGAIIAALGFLLRSFGRTTILRRTAIVLVLCSTGVQLWHNRSVEREPSRIELPARSER